MTTISLNGNNYLCRENESVLDVLLKADIAVPYGCREGVCQSCLLRSLAGKPPVAAQKGLKDTLQNRNYFLACQCYPDQDLKIAFPDSEGLRIKAYVTGKENLNAEIVRLTLAFESEFEFLAGQFVNLSRADGLSRSYSIANIPGKEKSLEFHIRRLPNGRFSTWVHDEAEEGTELILSEAKGSCYYLPGQPEQPLLLVGTGSGLAPLYGILQDALTKGHSGPIQLYHGSRYPEGLYLIDEMRQLSNKVDNFEYIPCVSANIETQEFAKGRVNDIALASAESLTGWKVFLCGHPEMVSQTKMMAYLKGASLSNIYADAFHTNPPAAQ